MELGLIINVSLSPLSAGIKLRYVSTGHRGHTWRKELLYLLPVTSLQALAAEPSSIRWPATRVVSSHIHRVASSTQLLLVGSFLSIPECGFLVHHPYRYFPSKLCRATPSCSWLSGQCVVGGLASATAQTFYVDGFLRHPRGWLLGEFCWHNISAIQWVKASPFPT